MTDRFHTKKNVILQTIIRHYSLIIRDIHYHNLDYCTDILKLLLQSVCILLNALYN